MSDCVSEKDWVLAFKGSSGAIASVYDLWNSAETNVTDHSLTLMPSVPKRHYKAAFVELWGTLGIKKVNTRYKRKKMYRITENKTIIIVFLHMRSALIKHAWYMKGTWEHHIVYIDALPLRHDLFRSQIFIIINTRVSCFLSI